MTYVVLPAAAPLAGITTWSNPAIGIPVSLVAIGFDLKAVRRFWLARHPWRSTVTVLYAAVIAAMVVLLVNDVVQVW